MKQRALCYSTLLLVIALGLGCEMAEVIQENTEGIKTTNRVIAENTTAVTATTQTMETLESRRVNLFIRGSESRINLC